MSNPIIDLVLAARDHLAADDLERIGAAATSFPMDHVVARYRQDFDVSEEEAHAHERELKRFFILIALHPDRPYGMRGPVDDLWHTFLIFTESYQQFSKRLVGRKRFLHHHPCSTAKGSVYPLTYDGFWYDYEETFGEPPPADVWPAPSGDRRDWDDIRAEIDHRLNRAQPYRDVDDGRRDAADMVEESFLDDVSGGGCGGGGCGGGSG